MTLLRDEGIELRDGRRLAYAEWGDLDGKPIFFFHGTPHSRLWCPDERVTRSARVRLITVDRPGIGRSDVLKTRKFADWPADVVALADALGIDRFAVVGWSSGGAYAAACAALISPRLTAAGIVSTRHLGQYNFVEQPSALDALDAEDRAEYDAAQTDPEAAAEMAAARCADLVANLRLHPESLINAAKLPEGDRWMFEDENRAREFFVAVAEAVRQGTDGYRWDEVDVWLPWGFRLDAIPMRVHVWHGDQDRGVARVHVDFTVRRIPQCTLLTWADCGHFGVVKHWDEILAALS